MLNDLNVNNLKCVSFPGKVSHTEAHSNVEIVNRTYKHWRSIWTELVWNGKQDLKSDNFLRQDLICSIQNDLEVVGMIGCNFFKYNQLAVFDHSYVSCFPKNILENEIRHPDSLFMSIEYLSVSDRWRKTEVGISLGDILLGLSMKVFEQSPAQIVLGTARLKNHVDKMCFQFGFKGFAPVDRFGMDCFLIVNSKFSLREHPKTAELDLINKLWNEKNDFSKLPYLIQPTINAA